MFERIGRLHVVMAVEQHVRARLGRRCPRQWPTTIGLPKVGSTRASKPISRKRSAQHSAASMQASVKGRVGRYARDGQQPEQPLKRRAGSSRPSRSSTLGSKALDRPGHRHGTAA